MTDNNNTNDYGDMSSVVLVDLLHKRDQQVNDLTVTVDRLRSRSNELMSGLTSTVGVFIEMLLEDEEICIADIDGLREAFSALTHLVDIDFPEEEGEGTIDISATVGFEWSKRGKVDLDEIAQIVRDEIETRIWHTFIDYDYEGLRIESESRVEVEVDDVDVQR